MNRHSRLESLDILRGLDLFLLVGLQPVLISVGRHFDHPAWQCLMYQLDHEVWTGFRFWDIVMPLFLFMTGAAMPFSFSKYLRGDVPLRHAWLHVAKRVIVLWILGMVVQGNLLSFRPAEWLWYTNTLQAIAAGYLLASILMLCFNLRMQLWLTLGLLLCYSIPMSAIGDWTVEHNFAARIDAMVLGTMRGDITYTWIWSSLTFGVTVMLGTFASQIIRRYSTRATVRLAAAGCAFIAVAMLWSLETPIIKRIWSGSMTLLSGGICFLLMAIMHWWVDVKHHTTGLLWLKIYGMNSITAYILGEVVNFRSIAASVSWGLEPILGQWWDTWLTTANYLIVFLILLAMYRTKTFIKI